MKRGDIVKFSIQAYPNERTGVIVRKGKVHSVVKVQYPSKYMLIRKKNTELKEGK